MCRDMCTCEHMSVDDRGQLNLEPTDSAGLGGQQAEILLSLSAQC